MGLDNGLVIKGKTLRGKEVLVEDFDYLEKYNGCYELGYWRKCWNIREKFLEVFSKKDYDGRGGEFTLTVAELYDIMM